MGSPSLGVAGDHNVPMLAVNILAPVVLLKIRKGVPFIACM